MRKVLLLVMLAIMTITSVGCVKKGECQKRKREQAYEQYQKAEKFNTYFSQCVQQMKDAAGPNNTATDWSIVMKQCQDQAYSRIDM